MHPLLYLWSLNVNFSETDSTARPQVIVGQITDWVFVRSRIQQLMFQNCRILRLILVVVREVKWPTCAYNYMSIGLSSKTFRLMLKPNPVK